MLVPNWLAGTFAGGLVVWQVVEVWKDFLEELYWLTDSLISIWFGRNVVDESMKGRQVYLILGLLGAGGRHLSWFVVWLIAEQSIPCGGKCGGPLEHLSGWLMFVSCPQWLHMRRCWCWSILTVGSLILLVRIWKTVVWLWFGRWPYNDLVEVPRPVVVWEVVSWRDDLLWIVLDW